MTTEEIVELFKAKPYYREMGKGKLSRRFHCTPEDIIKAKYLAYKHRNKKSEIKKLPRILILDIETAPLKAYIFKLWKENIGLDQIVSDWFCICWSAKWLYSNTIISDRLTPEEILKEDDKRIMVSLSSLLNECDIVITHNGEKFDLPKINARLLLNELPPVKPYQSIDTLKIAKTRFGFSSNKLDWLATMLHIPNKIDTTFELWKGCMEGNIEALEEMERYNRYDVELLEEVYVKLRPWIVNHPNMGLYFESEEKVCPNCGSTHLTPKGFYYTMLNKYEVFQCECGAFSRVRKPADFNGKKNILNNNLR